MNANQKIVERQEFGAEDGARALGEMLDEMMYAPKGTYTSAQKVAVAEAAEALQQASIICSAAYDALGVK